MFRLPTENDSLMVKQGGGKHNESNHTGVCRIFNDYRVHVSDLAVGVSRKEIERAFMKYGSINEVCSFFLMLLNSSTCLNN